MKLRDKHYFEVGMLPFILIPVIAVTVGLTLWISDSHHETYPEPAYNKNWKGPVAADDKLKFYDNAAGDYEFEENDSAVFTFTGDTVLILSQPDPLKEPADFYKVLYKNLEGDLQTIDLPEAELKKFAADSTEVNNE
jgi:hypothetical protein